MCPQYNRKCNGCQQTKFSYEPKNAKGFMNLRSEKGCHIQNSNYADKKCKRLICQKCMS